MTQRFDYYVPEQQCSEEHSTFCYSLRHRLPTYDFFIYVSYVMMFGAKHININNDTKFYMRKQWPSHETERRRDHYMLPGPPLFGITCALGDEGEARTGSCWMHHLWKAACKRGYGKEIPRMRSILPPGNAKYTVTIRRHFWKTSRNSDETLWRSFARTIGARLIEDHDTQPMSLYDRIALYAGARMNFGVPNGPFSILYLTNYPFMEFCDPSNSEQVRDFARHNFKPGDQLPWLRDNQKLVWQKPALSDLMKAYHEAEERSGDDHGSQGEVGFGSTLPLSQGEALTPQGSE